jgi:hypothetical protein
MHAAMRDALSTAAADGWQPECDGAWGFCFAKRGNERIEIGLQSVPAGAATYGPSVHSAILLSLLLSQRHVRRYDLNLPKPMCVTHAPHPIDDQLAVGARPYLYYSDRKLGRVWI